MADRNAALLAANERLLQLRDQAQKARETAVNRPDRSLSDCPPGPPLRSIIVQPETLLSQAVGSSPALPQPATPATAPNQAGGAANTPRAAGQSPSSSWELQNALAYVAMLQEKSGKRPSLAPLAHEQLQAEYIGLVHQVDEITAALANARARLRPLLRRNNDERRQKLVKQIADHEARLTAFYGRIVSHPSHVAALGNARPEAAPALLDRLAGLTAVSNPSSFMIARRYLVEMEIITGKPGLTAVSPAAPDEAAPEPQPGDVVTVYGRFWAQAQALRYELSQRLWELLRYVDRQVNEGKPQGRVSSADIRAWLTGDGRLSITSWANLRKQLNQAEKRGYGHWGANHEHFYLASRERVAAAVLGLNTARGWAVNVPVDDFTGDFVNIRALAYSLFHAGRGDNTNPISRRAIRKILGRWKKTQRRYEDLGGIKKAPQIIPLEPYTQERYTAVKANRDPALAPALVRMHLVNGRKRKYIVVQRPNVFFAVYATAKSGRRWLNERMSHLRKKVATDPQPGLIVGSSHSDVIQPRLNFDRRHRPAPDDVGYLKIPGAPNSWQPLGIT